jgi:hypothetical protein
VVATHWRDGPLRACAPSLPEAGAKGRVSRPGPSISLRNPYPAPFQARQDLTLGGRPDLDRALDELESGEDERLSVRVERLLRDKYESERKMSAILEDLAAVKGIREQVFVLDEKRRCTQASLANAEVDDNGRPIAERLDELAACATEAGRRISALQDILHRLEQLESAFADDQADLDPLTRGDGGMRSLLVAADASYEVLIKSLDELEANLPARVDELLNGKRMAELRMEALKSLFGKLGAVETDIGSLLASHIGSLNAHVSIRDAGDGHFAVRLGEDVSRQREMSSEGGLANEQHKTALSGAFRADGIIRPQNGGQTA